MSISIDSFEGYQFWVKRPRKLNLFRGLGLTRLDKEIWEGINTAVGIVTRRGRISVSQLAHFTECTERAVYNSLRRLRAAELITSFTQPGCTTMYGLTLRYAGPRAGHRRGNPTDERSFRGTSEQPFRGQDSRHVSREDNTHSGKDKFSDKKTISLARTNVKVSAVCAPLVPPTPKLSQDSEQSSALSVQPAVPAIETQVCESPEKPRVQQEPALQANTNPKANTLLSEIPDLTADKSAYREPPEVTLLRDFVETLPISYALDEPVFQRIVTALASDGPITVALVDRFKPVALGVRDPQKWPVYIPVARAVAARREIVTRGPYRNPGLSGRAAERAAAHEAELVREEARMKWDAGTSYEEYVRQCDADGRAPLSIDEWLQRE